MSLGLGPISSLRISDIPHFWLEEEPRASLPTSSTEPVPVFFNAGEDFAGNPPQDESPAVVVFLAAGDIPPTVQTGPEDFVGSPPQDEYQHS